jgi:hypothetical protein
MITPFTFNAASMTVAGFAYVGNVDVVTPSGPAVAMRFTFTTADVAALSLYTPCTNHAQLNPQSTQHASALKGMTLDVLEFKGTVGGEAVDWTAVATDASTVPPAEPIAGGSGTIGGPISATITELSAPQLSVPGMTELRRSC